MKKRNKDGTFQYKLFKHSNWSGLILLVSTMMIGAYLNYRFEPVDLHRPLVGEVHAQAVPAPTINPTAGMNEDALIDYYATKYTTSASTQAHRKALLHCLYWKETRGGIDADAHGDNGLAGGPFQFHEPTYKSMRSKMIKEGVAKEMGSRDNFENAVDTTSWAISQGQAKQWGPYLRGECQ